jgi:hypothetical protein
MILNIKMELFGWKTFVDYKSLLFDIIVYSETTLVIWQGETVTKGWRGFVDWSFHDTKGKRLAIRHAEHINYESGVPIPKNQSSDVSREQIDYTKRIVLYWKQEIPVHEKLGGLVIGRDQMLFCFLGGELAWAPEAWKVSQSRPIGRGWHSQRWWAKSNSQ